MKLTDINKILEGKDLDIVVNVSGLLLPIENIKIINNQAVMIISASALEDRLDRFQEEECACWHQVKNPYCPKHKDEL